LCRPQPPEVAVRETSLSRRVRQNSVARDYYDAFYPNPEERERLMVVIADIARQERSGRRCSWPTLQASLRTLPEKLWPLCGSRGAAESLFLRAQF